MKHKLLKIVSLALAVLLIVPGCTGKDGYYVRVAPDSQGLDQKPEYRKMATLAEAKKYADENRVYGSVVVDGRHKTVYAPCGEVGSEILYQAKIVADFIRDDHFVYGNAPLNPGINHDAHIVSCDRLVDWILYRVGFTDQPLQNGKCVSGPGLTNWCIEQGFTKIESVKDLLPGDVIFVNPNPSGNPLHTFIYAGTGDDADMYYRYDAGSDHRIQSTQPFYEPINGFMYGYRAPSASAYDYENAPTQRPIATFDPSVDYRSVVRCDFDDPNNPDWKTGNHISGLGALSGNLKFRSTGNDPYIIYTGELGMDCSEIDVVRIRCINGTYSDYMEVFFTTEDTPRFTAEASASARMDKVGMSVDGDVWLEVVIDMRTNSLWKGKLTGLRLDTGTTTGEFKIDFISLDKIGEN